MKLWLKENHRTLLLVITYTVVAMMTYIVWFANLGMKWYFIVLVSLAIIAAGAVIGTFYIRSRMRENEEAKAADLNKENSNQ